MSPSAVPPPVVSLSRAQARRVALVAQGFRDPRHTVPTMRTFNRTLARTGVLQIDSVNVFQRAHYMPLFSRMGRYDTELLRRAAERRPRRIVEYWAHVAAFMPVDLWPHMGHRMARYREQGHAWMGLPERRELVASQIAEIRERGPSTSRDLDDGLPRKREHWGWNWSETKKALEYLFLAGELAVAGRNTAFERLYDLPERVVPAQHLHAAMP
ncbi:MAG TPA: crosslink repair DNA glycosylase YcaQ family protein, partial [Nocardioidaceae bacterium]